MRSAWIVLLVALAPVLASEKRVGRQSPYRPTQRIPQGFRQIEDEPLDDELDRNTVTSLIPGKQQVIQFRAQDAYSPRQDYPGQQFRKPGNKKPLLKEDELEEEKEEPDRLTLLLPQSKFNCGGKRTGYYADDGLGCEVFHYCQDNARHSWICPEGFVFHQVHLICMPPSNDNICTQSTKYHFINDYLYKPINSEEVGRKPNVTLRYSERYYPENFYVEDDINEAPQREAPIQVQQVTARPVPSRQPLLRQQPQLSSQVFHSPEEVNIPLHHRRPIPQSFSPQAYHPQSREEYY